MEWEIWDRKKPLNFSYVVENVRRIMYKLLKKYPLS